MQRSGLSTPLIGIDLKKIRPSEVSKTETDQYLKSIIKELFFKEILRVFIFCFYIKKLKQTCSQEVESLK